MSSKAKSAPSNNAPKKSKGVDGAAVTVASTDVSKLAPAPASGSGKPEKGVYDAEQERIKTEIDALQVKLVSDSFHSWMSCPLNRLRLSGCREGKNISDFQV